MDPIEDVLIRERRSWLPIEGTGPSWRLEVEEKLANVEAAGGVAHQRDGVALLDHLAEHQLRNEEPQPFCAHRDGGRR